MNNQEMINIPMKLFSALWLLIVVTSIYSAANLPAGLELPIHWDIQLEPDDYANKWLALLMLPGVSLLLAVLFRYLPKLEPRKQNLQRSQTAYHGIFWTVQLFLSVFQLFIFSNAWQWAWPMANFLTFAIGGMFLMLGNYITKTRSTFFVGIRTPWTLSDETVWRKVHRGAGWQLFVFGAVVVLLTPWAEKWTLIFALAGMSVIFLWATLYSYLLWRNLSERENLPSQRD